jgi:uncharacterized protein (UPF0261 family)
MKEIKNKSNSSKYILMLGCFDTKGEDFSYLYENILAVGQKVITINTGVMESSVNFKIDYNADLVARKAGATLQEIRNSEDRGKAVEFMGNGAAVIISQLVLENKIKGAIGMGGGGGTYIALSAMQEIPLGIPKLCLSTLAAKDVSRQVGSKDITLMSSVVDVAGLNSISKLLIKQAAAAICGMANVTIVEKEKSHGTIAISMFGNTTKCVNKCKEILNEKGYEALVFHANGVGGLTMESLIREGCFDAVLDVTTTELADELFGGICSAGPDRMTAASEMGIPQIVAPGCLDMVNFAHIDTLPEKYKDRQLYSWAPDVTLMRTNAEENRKLGEVIARKINKTKAPAAILLPNKGISQIDTEGGIFYQPTYNRILLDTIKEKTKAEILVLEFDLNINDDDFANVLVENLLKIL